MKKLFISHSQSDSLAVELFMANMKEYRKDVVFNQANIAMGDDIHSYLKENIRSANAIIFFISSSSLHSPWVSFEVGAAQALGKKVIPIIIDQNIKPEDLPESIRDLMFLSVNNKSSSELVKKIGEAIDS